MSFRAWLTNLRSALAPDRGEHPRPPGSVRGTTLRLGVEALEDRLTPSLVWGGTSSSAPAGVEWAPQPPPPLLADFTGDGILDRINGGWVTVEPGLGDGTFPGPIEAGAWAHYWAVADFNDDGWLDVATIDSNWAGDNPLGSVLLGRGDGAFYHVEPIDVGFAWPTGMGTGDFNGDGRQDVAIVGEEWDGAEAFVVLINDGNWPSSLPPPPLPSLSIGDRTVTEGNSAIAAATFTVTLSAANTQPITVAFTTADGTATAGSDFQSTSGTLTFAPGETSRTITVPVFGDRAGEANETFVVNLSSPSNATLADAQGVGTIVDDEPRVSLGSASAT